MPRSRTSIRSKQNHAARIHGDGRMAFKHDQSGMIGDRAFLWEDFRSTFALRRNRKHQMASGLLKRRRHVNPEWQPNPKVLRARMPVTASALQPCSPRMCSIRSLNRVYETTMKPETSNKINQKKDPATSTNGVLRTPIPVPI